MKYEIKDGNIIITAETGKLIQIDKGLNFGTRDRVEYRLKPIKTIEFEENKIIITDGIVKATITEIENRMKMSFKIEVSSDDIYMTDNQRNGLKEILNRKITETIKEFLKNQHPEVYIA